MHIVNVLEPQNVQHYGFFLFVWSALSKWFKENYWFPFNDTAGLMCTMHACSKG